MEYNKHEAKYTLSTGKKVNSNDGAIGVCNGRFVEGYQNYVIEELTTTEEQELALEIIRQLEDITGMTIINKVSQLQKEIENLKKEVKKCTKKNTGRRSQQKK